MSVSSNKKDLVYDILNDILIIRVFFLSIRPSFCPMPKWTRWGREWRVNWALWVLWWSRAEAIYVVSTRMAGNCRGWPLQWDFPSSSRDFDRLSSYKYTRIKSWFLLLYFNLIDLPCRRFWYCQDSRNRIVRAIRLYRRSGSRIWSNDRGPNQREMIHYSEATWQNC